MFFTAMMRCTRVGLLTPTYAKKNTICIWVTDITQVCQQLFHLFNWGANYEKLVQATALWKLHLRNLVRFSETRFANSRRQVYVNILHEFPAIVSCLEEQITNGLSYPCLMQDVRKSSQGQRAERKNSECSLLVSLIKFS